jgi:hypothetical protein
MPSRHQHDVRRPAAAGAAPGRAFVRLAQPGHRSDTIVADGYSQHNGGAAAERVGPRGV